MPARRPIDSLRPGSVPELGYGFGRDYAVPMLTRRAFGRGDTWMTNRETLPCRLNPAGTSSVRRPPC